ncbi:hypothetical protein HYFRA_00005806 [Hymenoscyphus fraxineus]|uniref:Uncharacterized protein n=1 Tax=Hymenoscyphus fraxineus TaxID=746836 RepID=A0A9N9PP29_9HELO|nr:hypothetical protein HYFRA_00005806 [Hymenoscyphus fraxineus]
MAPRNERGGPCTKAGPTDIHLQTPCQALLPYLIKSEQDLFLNSGTTIATQHSKPDCDHTLLPCAKFHAKMSSSSAAGFRIQGLAAEVQQMIFHLATTPEVIGLKLVNTTVIGPTGVTTHIGLQRTTSYPPWATSCSNAWAVYRREKTLFLNQSAIGGPIIRYGPGDTPLFWVDDESRLRLPTAPLQPNLFLQQLLSPFTHIIVDTQQKGTTGNAAFGTQQWLEFVNQVSNLGSCTIVWDGTTAEKKEMLRSGRGLEMREMFPNHATIHIPWPPRALPALPIPATYEYLEYSW